ncbi:NfeD family protein, partial [Clostridium sp. HCS.1]|uniref:NfeD family protein n=1 Tax=Clostridium sp. HCS.1 TaxID=3238594 RepID=UPI003A0FDDBD
MTVSFGYPWAKKKFKKSVKRTPLMEETYIGRRMKAEEYIIERAKVKVDGIYWTVVNTGEKINSGENFKIIGSEGIKLIIKKEEEIYMDRIIGLVIAGVLIFFV